MFNKSTNPLLQPIQEEEERKIQLKQERAEKRRLLKIKLFRDSIQKTILENPVLRDEAYASTEISEIDNNDNEGPFGKKHLKISI